MIGPLFILGMGWFNDWRSAFYVPAAAARHRGDRLLRDA